jgi:hypothetical protein
VWLRERCAVCPKTRLDRALQGQVGETLHRAFRLNEMRNKGVTFSIHDLDSEEAYALDVIWSEIEKYKAEKQKEQR